MKFRVGTRGSPLALVQADWARVRWEARGIEVEIVVVETQGDRVQDRRLNEVGGQGLFTKDIEQALLDGRIDAAVHSLKDVPSRLPAGCRLGAVTQREDPRDVLVVAPGIDPDALSGDARIGTSSLRREAIWRTAHPSHQIVGVRGNLGTRLKKLGHEVDGLIVAAAGLHRMGQQELVSRYLDPGWMVPSPGQGALGIEVRTDDAQSVELAGLLSDPEAETAAAAERRVLAAAGGSCQIPLGAYASREGGEWNLHVFFARPDEAPLSLGWRGPELAVGVEWVLQEIGGATEGSS